MSSDSSAPRRRRRDVTTEEVHDLYVWVKGYRYANTVFDAEVALRQGDMEQALKLLKSVRGRYAENHDSVVRRGRRNQEASESQTRRLEKQQEKGPQTLAAFDDVIAGLDRMVRQSAMQNAGTTDDPKPAARAAPDSSQPPAEAPSSQAPSSQAPSSQAPSSQAAVPPGESVVEGVPLPSDSLLPEGFRAQYDAAQGWDDQFAVIQRFFGVGRINRDRDIKADRLYCIRGSRAARLVHHSADDVDGDSICWRSALTGEPWKTVSREKFLEWGKGRAAVRLGVRAKSEPEVVAEELKPSDASRDDYEFELGVGQSESQSRSESQSESQSESHTDADDRADDGSTDDERTPDAVLDMGAFTQLADSARRTGLVPNIDLITHVRDREFRKRQYQTAFQLMEGLQGKFTIACSQREQRLRREDMDISSGKVRMSPKQLLIKRAKDQADNQLIDRARSRFQRVMEGLRVLMRTQGPDGAAK